MKTKIVKMVEVSDGHIMIKPGSTNRKSWNTAFKKMGKNKDDILLDTVATLDQSKWNRKEWKWRESFIATNLQMPNS